MRATRSTGSEVLPRTLPTTRSMVSAVCAAQSPPVPATGGAYPWPVRRTLALGAAAVAASLTALILGEYELTLATAAAAGLVVGFGLPEIVLGIARWRGAVPAAVGAILAGGSLLWAGWISSGRGVAPLRATVWVGVVLAAALTAVRLRPRSV